LRELDEMRIIRKIFSKLREKKHVKVVDILGGVDDKKNHWLHWPHVRRGDECQVFRIVKELERRGQVVVEYHNGRNYICRVEEDETETVPLSALFGR